MPFYRLLLIFYNLFLGFPFPMAFINMGKSIFSCLVAISGGVPFLVTSPIKDSSFISFIFYGPFILSWIFHKKDLKQGWIKAFAFGVFFQWVEMLLLCWGLGEFCSFFFLKLLILFVSIVGRVFLIACQKFREIDISIFMCQSFTVLHVSVSACLSVKLQRMWH